MGGHPGISSTAGGVSLDTSGEVLVQVATSGGPFADLSPFEQGYVEAMLRGVTKPFEIAKVYKTRAGASVCIMQRDDARGYECVKGDDPLNDRPGGGWRYNRASDRGRVTGSAFDMSDPRNLIPENVGFSDLAPETLAAIRKDCADWCELMFGRAGGGRRGAQLWAQRNGKWTAWPLMRSHFARRFPPLTVTLGDDGKVRTSPVDDATEPLSRSGKTQTPTPSLGTQEEQDR